MRYLVGFICVLALGVMWCSGEPDGICRGSLSDYCAKVECPTWDEAVAEAQCDGFWEVGTCEDLGYVFHWYGLGDHWVKYFDTSGALVAVESWSDAPSHCDFMSNSIWYGPVPHCDRCAAPFSDYCLFDCPTWNAERQCEGFEATLVDASDCFQADRYCASNCPLQDREGCVEQYLSTGSCGTGGTAGAGGAGGTGGSAGEGGNAGSAGSGGVGGIGGGSGCVGGDQEQDAITCINGEAPPTDAGTIYFSAENCADAANTVYDVTLANADGITQIYMWVGVQNGNCQLNSNRTDILLLCRPMASNLRTVGDNATVFDLTLQELVDTGIVDCSNTATEGQHYEIYSFHSADPGSTDVPPTDYGVAPFKVGVTLPE